MTSAFEADFRQFCAQIPPENARFRLAPTPSGYLHEGNLYNFRLNHTAARLQVRARLLLRIDDLDADRKRPEYVQNIFDTLYQQGMDWDEGPRDLVDFETNWSQRLRMEHYHAFLQRLRDAGLLFACGKSRRELAANNGQYLPEWQEQGLSLDAPEVAWRLRTPPDSPLPFVVLRRRDGIPAYQVASICDDLFFGVTHVIRGADLELSTRLQQWLAVQAGYPAFAAIRFLHHPLVLNADGEKLSKSGGR